ncbi:MAG: Gfo/Idh/MocA family oxidoreductase [bacterium]|nr:Gfo/Idh/MocA family oxidoreductase [bacterium]
MDKVRLGIIGAGVMGSAHAKYVLDGSISRCELAAVADFNPANLEKFDGLKRFTDSHEMITSGEVAAVLIATPHYFHTEAGIDALENGLHVLVEKPISVHKADAERLIAAHTNKDLVFAAMFCVRTVPQYKKIKQLIDNNELGKIERVNWIVTNWFRPEAYYRSSAWRATWKGEGGGVLLNQCPHQLDLLQWMCGMPSSIQAFCDLGVYHDIEVEDRVTAFLRYPNGATGLFVTSTGEAPGTNRLEIAGEMGKLVFENDELTFARNEVSARVFCDTTDNAFGLPEVWNAQIPVSGKAGVHAEITQNFVDAILDGTPLIAPAEEGIKSIELANAMLYSSLKNTAVELPLDGAAFAAELQRLIDTSTHQKATA